MGNGLEALEMMARARPDVVLMDLQMPVMNGVQTTRRLRRDHPQVYVLILTTYADDAWLFDAIRAGAAGYLLKDVSVDQLIRAVRAVHAGESMLHPAITRKVISHFAQTGEKGAAPSGSDQITERELEVLKLAAQGLSNRDIALQLGISVRTAQTHLSNVFNKIGVGSRTEAVMYALRQGLITLEDTL